MLFTMHSGILFLDKPLGWSSRRAVNEMVRIYTPPKKRRVKAGHTGTLDPLATGMLPILIGEATRFANHGLQAEKTYEVTFDLSIQTDTLDCEGEVTSRFDGTISPDHLMQALAAFQGEIKQVPPIYSAIHVNGQRAHQLARKGEKIELQARQVMLHQLELSDFSFPYVSLMVRCSKGTYIRALTRDIGAALGMGGCVIKLRRISTAGWAPTLMRSHEVIAADPESSLLPLSAWLKDLPSIDLDDAFAQRFVQGQRLQLEEDHHDADSNLAAVYLNGQILGTGTIKQGQFRPVLHPARILPSAQELFI
ncbi:MAG: tRNA pseudouridine(55) synthase TruB [Mariprofundaceae bacterium]